MLKNNPNTFSEKDLDNLLNKSFLGSHFAEPKYEKITEAIAAYALGVKRVETYAHPSFIKRMIGKISLQVFLIGSLVLTGGTAGILFLRNNPEKLKKNNTAPSSVYKQTHEVSDAIKGVKEDNTPTRSNPEISYKNMQKRSSMKNDTDAQLPTHNNIVNNLYGSEKYTMENNISTLVANNDSIPNYLVIQRPEPIYFDYLQKERDSISANSKTIENTNTRNDIPKKKKLKLRKRSTAKERNKNKTERDRSGKTYNF